MKKRKEDWKLAVGGGGKKEGRKKRSKAKREKKQNCISSPSFPFPLFRKKKSASGSIRFPTKKKKKTGKKKGREGEGGPSKAAHRKGIIRPENKNRIVFETFLINSLGKNIFLLYTLLRWCPWKNTVWS